MVVLNTRHMTGAMPANAIYIGCEKVDASVVSATSPATGLFEPFVVPPGERRADCLVAYEQELVSRVVNGCLRESQLRRIAQCSLVCNCDQPMFCHGHVIERVLQWAVARLDAQNRMAVQQERARERTRESRFSADFSQPFVSPRVATMSFSSARTSAP